MYLFRIGRFSPECPSMQARKKMEKRQRGAAVREKNTQTRAAMITAEVSLLRANPADNDQVRKIWSTGWQGWHLADWLSWTSWTVQGTN